jgi:hypothetical protein
MKEDIIITQTNRVIIFNANCIPPDLGECISRSQLDSELTQAMHRKNCASGSVYYSKGAYYSTVGGSTDLYHRFKIL